MVRNTVVTICNSVLTKLGSEPITSLDDSSREARLCREQYYKIKHALLYEHTWNFAKKRVKLNRSPETAVFEYRHAYNLPSDMIRIIKTSLDDNFLDRSQYNTSPDPILAPSVPYKIEGDKLITNFESVFILYVSGDTDEGLFTSGFAELLSKKLAMDLCYALVSDVQLFAMMRSDYMEYAKQIRSFNAQDNELDSRLGNGGLGEYVTSRF